MRWSDSQQHPKAHTVLGKGANKASINIGSRGPSELTCGRSLMKATVRRCSTSPAARNTISWCGGRALKLGLTLNEYRLFRLENEERVGGGN